MRPLNTWLGSNAPQLVGIGASLGLLAGFAVLFVMGTRNGAAGWSKASGGWRTARRSGG
jgi:hypothetical protein